MFQGKFELQASKRFFERVRHHHTMRIVYSLDQSQVNDYLPT